MEKAVLFCALLVHLSHSQPTLDVTEPIVREPPNTLDDEGYFGYSVVLHRKSDGPRIIVSAPNGTAENGEVDNVGLIFECPINPGTCEPLIDPNSASGTTDARLFDVEENVADEYKENQFLGVSMESDDNFFLVCAHRHIYRGANLNRRYPMGKCYYTENRDLVDFEEYVPCRESGRSLGNYGSCQVGSSATLARMSGSVAMGLGAPGSVGWTGAIFRYDPSSDDDDDTTGSGVSSNSWQGYAITKGRLISSDELHFAVSVPRSSIYTGNVNIYSNTPSLQITMTDELRGVQMGEYYGFSLATADLNGDNFDELIVGAPMYSIRGVPEIGRVFIYLNTQGSLQLFDTLIGDATQEYARFGHAIVNLGDINGDGFDDIAIGAPFSSNGGTVYIYHGSQTLTQTIMAPAQVITGAQVVESLSGIDPPIGFGSSLASSVDVDNNKINDLAVGAFRSQQVFLFRSRAVARISTQLSSNPPVVNLMEKNCTGGYACFNITIVASYPDDETLPPMIEVNFEVTVDDRGVAGLTPRVFFDSPDEDNIKTLSINLTKGETGSLVETVFVKNNTADIFNGFSVDVTATGPSFMPSSMDGNPPLTNLALFPITVTSPEVLALQVELFNDCEGSVCVPDLAVDVQDPIYETSNNEDIDVLIAGLVTSINVDLTFSNMAEDSAYSAELEILFPAASFELVRIEPTTFLIARPPTTTDGITSQQYLIGNPLDGRMERDITARFRPLNTIAGNEGSFQITFRATSINEEDVNTQGNNEQIVTIPVNARADVTLDQAVADPEQLTYENSRDINATHVMDLGPGVTVSFLVLNLGPSTIPLTRMSIFWPFRAVGSDYFYLYPAQLMVSSSSASVMSSTMYVNPEGLSTIDDSTDQGGNEVVETEGKKKRKRRRRSLAPVKSRKRSLRPKRQSSDNNNDQAEVNEVTVDCRENNAECVEFTFTIVQLPRDSSVQIDVVSYLDERFFQDQVDTYTFIASANLSINNDESAFIVQPDNHQADEIDVQVRVVNAVPTRGGDSSPNLLAIILPIVFGVIFFIVLGIILYFVGFFKRKHKQRKEEIQAEILGEQQGEFPDQPSAGKD